MKILKSLGITLLICAAMVAVALTSYFVPAWLTLSLVAAVIWAFAHNAMYGKGGVCHGKSTDKDLE